ncbi:MAG TPA: hypothetical protein DD405_07880, partial [Desulfobacteraceae bacterium]|nr:hypothetical protein [Desulfobacteraceae bacterium]
MVKENIQNSLTVFTKCFNFQVSFLKDLDVQPIKICQAFFKNLNQKKISYCHWKSNSHLMEGLAGYSDLDLLISTKHKAKIKDTLDKFEFKQVFSPPPRNYPDLEDYIGFDQYSGKLVHFHIHYKLILGEQLLKNYHLPIETLMLNSTKLDNEIKIPARELELLMLIIRSCMKVRVWDILLLLFRIKPSLFPPGIIEEYNFLISNYSPAKFEAFFIKTSLPLPYSKIAVFISKITAGNLSSADILKMRYYIFNKLRPFRRHNYINTLRNKLKNNIYLTPGLRKIFPLHKKHLGNKGILIAIVGADGSGKTTLVKDLAKWLSWKMQVRTLYFGIPKTLPLKIINKLISFLRFPARISLKKVFAPVVNLEHYVSVRRWIWVAGKRLQIYQKALAWTEKGMIVISDRYPLSNFW